MPWTRACIDALCEGNGGVVYEPVKPEISGGRVALKSPSNTKRTPAFFSNHIPNIKDLLNSLATPTIDALVVYQMHINKTDLPKQNATAMPIEDRKPYTPHPDPRDQK